jgi:ABC-type branched-subunit amino acid transport system ATPase component
MPMLQLENVVASYIPGVEILRGVNLRVEQGEIVCLVGPNGAGKSTVLRAVSGFLKPSKGSITFNGKSIGGMAPQKILMEGITHVPQGHSVFPKMTIHENLLMGAFTILDKNVIEQRLNKVYSMFSWLKTRANEKAPLMILDEPSLGLAPKTMSELFENIRELNRGGLTILMVEQNAREGLASAHRGYVLELGKEKFEGTAKELLDSPEMAKLYLGGSTDGESYHRRSKMTATPVQ